MQEEFCRLPKFRFTVVIFPRCVSHPWDILSLCSLILLINYVQMIVNAWNLDILQWRKNEDGCKHMIQIIMIALLYDKWEYWMLHYGMSVFYKTVHEDMNDTRTGWHNNIHIKWLTCSAFCFKYFIRSHMR